MKRFKILTLIISILVLATMIAGCTRSEGFFTDKNLEAAIRGTLELFLGEELTNDDLANLSVLSAPNSNITDLSGIENCINLNELDLSDNSINDIYPIYSLDNLVILNLENNEISQIPGPCSLFILTDINLDGNQISDISAFSSLSNLAALSISDNQLTDISPLTSLYNLTRLNLNRNQINDISPLLENSGLGEGDFIYLEDNDLNLTEGSEDMQNIRILEGRGVIVSY